MVLPGRILSSLAGLSDEQREQWARTAAAGIPAGRLGRPEDLGGIVVYLASDASSYHTGDLITIDGGQSIAVH
jgi:NAD(P)-dependent dehydrogenase (short-subunit alcohol dehydrogenase family)